MRLFALSMFVLSCTGTRTLQQDDEIMELAINKVKDGKLEEFQSARAAFIAKMKTVEGVGADAGFKSFFTMPGELEGDVYAGVTEWASMQAFGNAFTTLAPTDEFKNYFATFDQLAYVQLQRTDGGEIDITKFTKPGQAVEFAVRKPKPGFEASFKERRDAFFAKVAEQKGYEFDWEFVEVGAGNSTAVVIVWDSVENFNAGLAALSTLPETANFFGAVDGIAYQATTLIQGKEGVETSAPTSAAVSTEPILATALVMLIGLFR